MASARPAALIAQVDRVLAHGHPPLVDAGDPLEVERGRRRQDASSSSVVRTFSGR